MKLSPVEQRPLFRIRCGQHDAQAGRRCYHDATVADLDGKAFAIESYYCDTHRPQEAPCTPSSSK